MNVFQPRPQYATRSINYVARRLGLPIPSTAPLAKISDRFGGAVHRFCETEGIPWRTGMVNPFRLLRRGNDFGPDLSPTDPAERLTPVVEAFTALIVRSEAQQRSMLRVSLNEDTAGRSALPLRQGSEKLLPARNVRWNVRSLGERGILAAVDAVLVARPPVSTSSAARPPRNGSGCGLSNATSAPP